MESTRPKVVAISGVKNAGKTTLIKKLVKELTIKGYKIGVIKHDGHDFTADQPGTDTYEIKKVGAKNVMIYSKSKLMFIKDLAEEPEIEDLLLYYKDMDLVILEGFKNSNVAKIEIVRSGEKSICRNNLLAIATDDTNLDERSIPFLDLNNIEEIINCLRKNNIIN
ncbi:MAG: molybdopterin-guanine dinucleotide biosynthesis protein B [Candidatus Epulonipiscioides saccharophilum]|nr:MAG: molybdopterin-guanine dinucleotide biosynthesis protein B [Epulopiscium sp. AS2M-Bin001]